MGSLLAALLLLHGAPAGAPAAAAPPAGAYVDFDFKPLPETVGRKWTMTVKVETTQAGVVYSDRVGPVEGYLERLGLCEALVSGMEEAGFKAEVVYESRVRVYGRTVGGKYYPAVKGIIEAPDLKKDELPKVRGPK